MAQIRNLTLTALVVIALLLLVSDVARADSITNDSATLRIEDDGAHMRVASSSSLQLTGSMTIEMWARFDPLDATPGAEIVKRGDSNQGYGLGVNPGTRVAGGLFGQSSNLVSSPPDFSSGWHHFAWTYDGSTSTLYFDGSLLQQLSYTGSAGLTASDLFVGIGIEGDGTWNGATAQGWYDEIRIWNVARTAAQIESTWTGSLAGNESGLVGYWNFNSGTASDATSFGNHGELFNGAVVVPVPEPVSLMLVGVGVMGIAWGRRRSSRGTV